MQSKSAYVMKMVVIPNVFILVFSLVASLQILKLMIFVDNHS
jgi:hypothetical protein